MALHIERMWAEVTIMSWIWNANTEVQSYTYSVPEMEKNGNSAAKEQNINYYTCRIAQNII